MTTVSREENLAQYLPLLIWTLIDPIQIEQNNSVGCLNDSIIKEITERKKEKSKCYEDFRTLTIKKLKQDLKNTITREPTIKLLIERFSDLISDAKFMGRFASKLDYLLSE